jgi:hypothetical protein
MFETIAANTVPLILGYFSYALLLYGNEISQFIISKDNPAESISQIIEEYQTK